MQIKSDFPFVFALTIFSLSACTTSSSIDTASVDTTETSSSDLPEMPTGTVENSPTTAFPREFFELDKPINIEMCYDMVLDLCKQVWYRNDQLALGYHFPPGAIPSSWNRNVDFWQLLNETEKNDYLSTALWNFVARLGISGGVQSVTQDVISSEYQYALSNTNWLVESVNAGINPIQILETLRDEERKTGSQEWLIDWRINACIWVALPAIAPELIPIFDNIVIYNS